MCYHRRTTGALDLPEDEHEKRMEAILRAVPEEHKGWLTEKLRYSNELNLRKRIKHIFDEHPQIVDSVVGSGSKARRVSLIRSLLLETTVLTSTRVLRDGFITLFASG